MTEDLSSEQDDNSCPICFEDFKSPKLLPCRHTFCNTCLDAYVSRSRKVSDKISCPFCRSQYEIPKDGINGFLTNFYVDDKCFKTCPDLHENCSETLDLCLRSHESVDCNNEDAAAEDAKSEASDDCTFNIPLSLICVGKSSVQTNCKMKIDSAISLPPYSQSEYPASFENGENDSSENEIRFGMVNALCPTADNECLVVVNCNGHIFKISDNGKCSDQLHIGGEGFGLLDIALRNDDQILLLTRHDVFALQLESGFVYNFANIEPYFGLSIATFRDNRAVVGCYAREKTSEEETEDTDSSESGVMLIFSNLGDVMYKVVPGEDFPTFRPFDVAINPVSGLIYASDPTHGMVYIFLECGNFVNKVDGRVFYRWLRLESFAFVPCGISCDSSGNVIVCDRGSGNLVHLSSDGNLKGVFILETPTEEREIPYMVKLSDDGTIWVGYKPSCKVRTFAVQQFINRLD